DAAEYLLLDVPGECASAHADLVVGHARTPVDVDRVDQVLGEPAGGVGDPLDRIAGCTQHRVPDDADGTDGHRGSSSGVVSSSGLLSGVPGASDSAVRRAEVRKAAASGGSAPTTAWDASTPGTTVRSTVHPAATARSKTVTTAAISSAVSPSSGSWPSSAMRW